MEQPEISYGQIQALAEMKKQEKYQKGVSVINELDDCIYLLDVLSCIQDKVNANQSNWNALLKVIAIFWSLLSFFHLKSS